MISRVFYEWRKKDEPDQPAEFYIRTALKAAGYSVGHIATQGVWDEDKPKFAHGKWDASRLPHEEIAKQSLRSGRREAPGQIKKKKKEAASCKRQATSLTQLDDIKNYESK